jgi:uncharacterized protein (TIGR03083 family)
MAVLEDRRYDRYDVELRAETERIAEVLRAADPSTPVPTTPEWTLARLAEHVGHGQRWAATIVERRLVEPIPNADIDDARMPDDPDGRTAWLVAGARRLADAVRDAGPDAPVWTWAADRTAGFWLRRITHDTLVHRLDAELAVGRAVELAPDIAADGVSDLLMVFETLSGDHPDPILAGLRGTGQTLHFHATDAGLGEAGEWRARRDPSGVAWEHGHGRADVAVRGRALDLLLLLSRRAAPGAVGVEILGDRAVLDAWLEHSRM